MVYDAKNTFFHPKTFPVITHIDDILPHIKDNTAIRVYDRGDTLVLCYAVNAGDVFQTAYDIECRGITFDAQTGVILSRPLHKFFNFQERMTEEDVIAHGPGHYVEKLDGSMIAAYIQKDEVIFHTKGGVSPQAKAARADAREADIAAARDLIGQGYTPIFEWTSPENRIVVAYDESRLTLLAVRHTTTGVYNPDLAQEIAERYDLKTPDILGHASTAEEIAEFNKTLFSQKGIEGAVWVGPNGVRAKAKTASYLSVHRTFSLLDHERHVLRSVIEENDDDIAPILPPKAREAWQKYADAVRARILEIEREAHALAEPFKSQDRKEAAAIISKEIDADMRPLVFGALNGKNVLDSITGTIARYIGSDVRVQQVKKAYNLPDWTYIPPQ